MSLWFFRIAIPLGFILTQCLRGITGCEKFYNEREETLIIPEDEKCDLSNEGTWETKILKELAINGHMLVTDKSNIHLKFRKMSLGMGGVLKFGSKEPIQNHKIIFEEVGNAKCTFKPETEPGNIDASGSEFEIFYLESNAYAGDETIRAKSLTRSLFPGQKLLLFDMESREEEVTVKYAREGDIFLEKPLSKNHFIEKISPLHVFEPYAIPLLREEAGIVFKNLCLQVNVDQLSGVMFIDSKGLDFRGSVIRNNIFYGNRGISQYQEHSYSFENDLYQNIFVFQNNLSLDQSDLQFFRENTFFEMTKSTLKPGNSLEHTSFVNSSIELKINNRQTFSIDKAVLHNSQITVSNKPNAEMLLLFCSFYKQSSITFQNDVKVLRLVQSLLFESQLDFSNIRIRQQVDINECILIGNEIVDDFILLTEQKPLQGDSPLRIILFKTSIAGFKRSILATQQREPYPDKILIASHMPEAFFDVIIHNCGINDYLNQGSNRIAPLLNLPHMIITINEQSNERLQIIELHNLRNSNLKKPPMNFGSKQAYLVTTMPCYIQISNVKFLGTHETVHEKFDQIVKTMSKNEFLIEDQRPIQIVQDNIHRIFLKGPTESSASDIIEFDIEIRLERTKKQRVSEHVVIFENSNYAIKNVEVTQIDAPGGNTKRSSVKIQDTIKYEQKQEVLFVKPRTLNHLKVVWKKFSERDSAKFKVRFELCPSNTYLSLHQSCENECPSSVYLGLICGANCEKGFFLDQASKSCAKCQQGCATCINQDSCVACFPEYLLNQDRCIDVCDQGQFAVKNRCQECVDGCQSCKREQECKVCYHQNADKNCDPCQDNQTGVSGECENCHDSCGTCSGKSMHDCLSCAKGYSRKYGKCISDGEFSPSRLRDPFCQSGEFRKFTKCFDCPDGCARCSLQDNQAYLVCSLCKHQHYLPFQGSTCRKCEQGYYGENNYCKRCNQACDPERGCSGSSIHHCVKCAKGFFQVSQNGGCMPCDSKCFECANESHLCTDCPPERPLLNKGDCIEACPSGWFANNQGKGVQKCEECDAIKCEQCQDNPTNCIKCPKGQVLFEGECLKECSQGYFQDQEGTCQTCDVNKCKDCIKHDSKCTKCADGLYLHHFQCMEECPNEGYFFNQDLECQKCNDTCEKCEGDPDNCTECEYPLSLEKSQCVADCPTGKYSAFIGFTMKCMPCNLDLCKTCTIEKDNCIECAIGYYKIDSKCFKQCPVSYFQNEEEHSCVKCQQPNCSACSNDAYFCIQCSDQYYNQKGICVKSCSSGYFIDSSDPHNLVCHECDRRVCLECSETPQNCTSCYHEHFRLSSGICVATCPRNMYGDQSSAILTCKPCNSLCQKGCVGPFESDCLEVHEENFNAILIAILIPSCILIIIAIAFAIYFYRKKSVPSKKYTPRLLKSESQSDIQTLVQLEAVNTVKPN